MIEELYIVKNDERFKVDLNSPSGITLNFKSNIFGDLSKITCSYSYTFKLPLTLNNRLVFDSAEDIRHKSTMIRRKLVAEFYQNGIKIFDDANLYVDSIDNGYQAVMTWGVVRGLEKLKDDDISLRELPFTGMVDVARYGVKTTVPRPTTWNNKSDYFIPYRRSEGSYWYNDEKYIYGRETGSQELPVVPVQRIIDAINQHYGTTFYFGEQVKGSELWNSIAHRYNSVSVPQLIAFGGVPLVNRGLTEEQYASRTGTLKNIQVLNNSIWGIALTVWDNLTAYNVISFDYVPPMKNDYFQIGNNGSSGTTRKYTFFKNGSAIVEKASIDGYIRVVSNRLGTRWKGTKVEYHKNDETPKLIIYKRTFKLKEGSSTNGEIVYDEAATLEGKYLGTQLEVSGEYTIERYVYEFDFRAANGKSRIEISDFNSSETYPFFMSINDSIYQVQEASDFKIIPDGYMSDNINNGWETDIKSNLPDISCFNFMKALYYMIGAFPAVDSEGNIIPNYYYDISQKAYSNDALDWSDKLQLGATRIPSKITFAISGFARRNYYLMKNDDLEKKDSNEKEDIYESGMGLITCSNETLEKEKTVIQLPFYGAFLQDASRPNFDTGRDMKYFKVDKDDKKEFCEAKPAIGIVRPIEECKYTSTNPLVCQGLGTYAMVFHIWDGFKYLDEDPSYDTLQVVMSNPVIITENLKLNELDLRDLNYTRPIYLHKYNCLFAIVSIQRDSKGQCKCELIKIDI